MRITIPKMFKLLNLVYHVREPMEGELADNEFGECDFIKEHILLRLEDVPINTIEHTFFHEICHAILHAIGRDTMCEDEVFVDAFAAGLHQVFKTKKGNLFDEGEYQ